MSDLFLILCSLNVLILSAQALEFSIKPKSVIVRKGNIAILNCQTKQTSSNIFIDWKKGNDWILDYKNKAYSLLKNGSLYFPSVGKKDEDKYICGAFVSNRNTIIYSKPVYITLAYIRTNFIQPPSETKVREHKTALLTCITGSSQPLPSVAWEKDGQPVMAGSSMAQNYITDLNATSASLELKNVSLADAGYYRCVAINPLLPNDHKRSPKALLLVLPKDDKPRIEVAPVTKIAPIYSPLQMDCVIVGVPPPIIYWLHNGLKVKSTSDIVVYSNGSLYIKSLASKHTGQYSCNGTNDKGSIASPNIFLIVAYIDYIFKQNPTNKTAVNGSNVELECEAPSHYPPKNLIYKWYYNNYKMMTMSDRRKILPSGSLMFTQVLKSDEGDYFCEATNQYSRQTRTSTAAYLAVNVPPYFLITPSNQTVILYKNLHLSCVPQGSPNPRISWYHGNMLLSNSSTVYLGGDGSLNITSVETANAGLYECRIQNVAGIKTAVVFVNVHVPPNVTIMPKNTSVVLGLNASFYCQFTGNPPPMLSWYFNQRNEKELIPLSRNSSRFIQTKEQLHVLNIREKDQGWFTCVARNIVGLQNFSAYLNVLVPAYLTEFPRNTTVNETCTAVMVCRRYGNPQPTITWSKSGHLLFFNNKTTFNGTHLKIRNVTRNNSGIYSCTVENKLRKYTSSVYLTVQVSPTIQFFLGPSRTQWKNNVSFHCKFDGVPKPDVEWLKDSHAILYTRRIFAKGDTLNITSVGHNDTGNYTCKVSNNAGSTMIMKQLIVEVPPCRPLNLQLDNITSTSVHVLWKSGCDGFSPVTSFRLETRTANSSWQKVSDFIKTEFFTIENLRPHTSYDIRVSSENKIGWSTASESITLRTNEDSPSTPVDFKCRLYNSTAMNLTWGKPSSPNGVLRQYRVQFKTFAGLDVEESITTPKKSSIIHGLKSYTIYKFRIQAATGNQSLLWGNYTSYVKCRTGESAPTVAPLNFSVGAVGSDTIMAIWQVIPAAFRNGVVRKYCIQYKRTTEKLYTKKIECIPGNKTTQYNISGLRPWTEYTVRISAETVHQGPWSEERISRTNESEPTGAPTNILVRATSSRSLSIKWDPPLENDRNGVLIGYTAEFYSSDKDSIQITNVTSNETSIEISGLLIYTSYNVRIRAFTKVGFGPFSRLKIARTGESYPDPVENVTKTIRNDSVLIRWQPPGTPNGIIISYSLHYNVTVKVIHTIPGTNVTVTNITTQTQTIMTDDTNVILNGIHGNVTYFLCVAASTSIGYGDCSKPIIFVTNFTLTEKLKPGKPVGFTPSIVDDHLPLIAAGATICFVVVIALFTCWIVRTRNRKNEEKRARLTYNFRGRTFRMDSFCDGESSRGSHGSRPINDYSMDSTSLNSRTNASNTFASRQAEGRDMSSRSQLRNNSLHLGSNASSYDDPYSSVAEIGVEASNVDQDQIRSSEDPLYAQVHGSFSDNSSLNSCVVNPIYRPTLQQQHQQPHINAGFSRDTNESDQLYRTNLPDKAARVSSSSISVFKSPPSENSMEGIDYYSSDEDQIPAHNSRNDVLILPPPPPEYSDDSEHIYDEVELRRTFENAVTDF